MGSRKVLDAAVDAGIPENTPGLMANARIPLGTNAARNIDMSSAYSTFAAQGEASQWYTVAEVKGSNGGSRYKHKVKKARVFEEDVMADVSYALQQVVKSGTGTEAQGVGRPVAGKTGTAEDRVGLVRRLHPADLGRRRLLQGRRHRVAGRRRGHVDVLRRRLPGPGLDGVHEGGPRRRGGHRLPAARRRRQGAQPEAEADPDADADDDLADSDTYADGEPRPSRRRPSTDPPGPPAPSRSGRPAAAAVVAAAVATGHPGRAASRAPHGPGGLIGHNRAMTGPGAMGADTARRRCARRRGRGPAQLGRPRRTPRAVRSSVARWAATPTWAGAARGGRSCGCCWSWCS